jgi:hypothetical protein
MDNKARGIFRVKSLEGFTTPKKRTRVLYKNQCPKKRID